LDKKGSLTKVGNQLLFPEIPKVLHKSLWIEIGETPKNAR